MNERERQSESRLEANVLFMNLNLSPPSECGKSLLLVVLLFFFFLAGLCFLFHVVLVSLEGSAGFCFYTCQKWLAMARG